MIEFGFGFVAMTSRENGCFVRACAVRLSLLDGPEGAGTGKTGNADGVYVRREAGGPSCMWMETEKNAANGERSRWWSYVDEEGADDESCIAVDVQAMWTRRQDRRWSWERQSNAMRMSIEYRVGGLERTMGVRDLIQQQREYGRFNVTIGRVNGDGGHALLYDVTTICVHSPSHQRPAQECAGQQSSYSGSIKHTERSNVEHARPHNRT